jgi:hypothetical protein
LLELCLTEKIARRWTDHPETFYCADLPRILRLQADHRMQLEMMSKAIDLIVQTVVLTPSGCP